MCQNTRRHISNTYLRILTHPFSSEAEKGKRLCKRNANYLCIPLHNSHSMVNCTISWNNMNRYAATISYKRIITGFYKNRFSEEGQQIFALWLLRPERQDEKEKVLQTLWKHTLSVADKSYRLIGTNETNRPRTVLLTPKRYLIFENATFIQFVKNPEHKYGVTLQYNSGKCEHRQYNVKFSPQKTLEETLDV